MVLGMVGKGNTSIPGKMHEISSHVIEIQIAEIPMKSLLFLKRNLAVRFFCKYVLIVHSGVVWASEGVSYTAMAFVRRVFHCWANRDAESNAYKLTVT